ncbi:MAG: hypothetical protein A4E57_04301 [Syntrophorhabdaceae bacterium PtaU1.Bin034]|nr:MAG: hypothetical protein A4E57_04301 [Syntrophorhabdaceae bacterium PtaU1.Bin034]
MPPIFATGQFASKARHDVAFAKTEFSADDLTALTPAPDVKAAGVKIIKLPRPHRLVPHAR